jgi:transcriptional regulator with XRE-family HTH domain
METTDRSWHHRLMGNQPVSFHGDMARKELLAIIGRLDLTPAKLADLLGVSRSLASKLTGGEDARSLKGDGAVLLRLLDARPDLVRVLEAGRYIPGERTAPEPTFGEDQRIVALLASVAGDPAVFAELVADVPEAGDPHRLRRFVERGYVTLDDGVPTVTVLGNETFRSQDVIRFWREAGCESPRETRVLTDAEWRKLRNRPRPR